MKPIKITEEQATKAYCLIHEIVLDASATEGRPMATQINLHPSVGEEMRLLVEEVRKQQTEEVE